MTVLSLPAAKVALDGLYREVPEIDCQGKCQSACGPIAFTDVEMERIVKKVGRAPTADPRTLTCSMLQGGLCRVYHLRPMICRLWGVVEMMRCPWGCEPERVLTTKESYRLLLRADVVSARTEADYEQAVRDLERLESGKADAMIELSKMMHVQPTLMG